MRPVRPPGGAHGQNSKVKPRIENLQFLTVRSRFKIAKIGIWTDIPIRSLIIFLLKPRL